MESETVFSWWKWHFHLELVLGVVLLEGLYLLGVGPLRRRYGWAPLVERRQVVLFSLGMVALYATITGPLHELSDHFLFSAHMVQHLILIFVVVPLLLWGMPPWLLRPLLSRKGVLPTARFLTHPVIAFILFNGVVSAWHLPALYDLALRMHWVHIFQHLMFLAVSVIMWWPLMSNLAELPRARYVVQIIYLFFQSLPTGFVGAAITFSHRPLYPWYEGVPRLWGLSVVVDQQIAGLLMKIPGALIFLAILVVVFFAWFNDEERGGRGRPEEEQPAEPLGESQLASRG